MRNSKVLAAALISSALSAAAPALAQEGKGFGQEGQAILSVDRLFGLAFTSTKNEDGAGGGTSTTSNTSVGLLWPGGQTPYQIPRLAFDANVASGFTVGGSIGFVSHTGTNKSEPTGGTSRESDAPTATLFAFAPRVGYALPLSDQFAFWPRVGVTYYSITSKDENTGPPASSTKLNANGLGLDIEPIFVFSPVSHFGITAGPILDVPLTGTASSERTPTPAGGNGPDDKLKFLSYGITLGILGYF